MSKILKIVLMKMINDNNGDISEILKILLMKMLYNKNNNGGMSEILKIVLMKKMRLLMLRKLKKKFF